MEVSGSRDRGSSRSRVDPAHVVAGSSTPLPTPSLQDLARLFLSLSGPLAQWDAVGTSLFAAAGVTSAGALPGPAAPVTSSAPLACASGSVPASGGATPVSAASAPGLSGRHERPLESPRSERLLRHSSSGGKSRSGVKRCRGRSPPLLALPVQLMRPLLL